MEITEIKERLSLSAVLQHYHLQPKNKMLHCFYHEDKTASLQVNLEKNFYKCHSCGKTGDVIQFIEDYEKLSKHEAIKKAESLIGGLQLSVDGKKTQTAKSEQPTTDTEFLERMFSYFKNALHSSKPAREYLGKRNLDNSILEIGYNSGQFHHGERKSEELIRKALEAGLLQDKGLINSRTGEKGYSPFAKWCICFALRNKEHRITGLYFRSALYDDPSLDGSIAKHFYLKNRSGIYPHYPNPQTHKLILTEAIIDAASLLQIKNIAENYSIIACFGTNGLNEEISQAIQEWCHSEQSEESKEIIFCFDNDEAGKKAVEKYSKDFIKNDPKLKISTVELPCKDVNETLQLHDESIFTQLLEERKILFSSEKRDSQITQNDTRTVILTKEESLKTNNDQPKTATDFLQQKNLLKSLNQLIEKAGIIGEEQSRLLLFLITISYLNKSPLHGIVQGSSGSGKTHIISRIADLMPQEDVLRFTRITESSLYNWGEFDLFQKIIIIEDLDGLKEDALYALREFISNQVLRSSVTIKDKKGNNKSSHKIVKGQFSSLSATTKGETYEDNMSRSFLLAVDESKEQTQRIIHYQNQRNAGEIDRNEQEKAIGFIQKLVRNLKHYEVINPFATKLNLPEKVHKIRRLNEMYQAVIKQVTFINQYQREVKNGYLITEIEDIEQATEVLFESIVLKVDELDGSLRQFFERLKKYVKNEHQEFILRDIRQEFNISKTQMFRHIQTLLELDYIKQTGGFANKGIKYKISYWDNHQKLRTEIKEFLNNQIRQLKNANGTQKEH
ncbi:CHC2 zinc finger domain-containing protein [Chryseobacterium sp. SL1]|uniref:CHC2 zinc finger domain-containing protein n=1 Tax=Chryseobacterium sp. SL1 TaxID=2995159 RepID=UPI00227351C6|nr:CHC2 zinc finger domain-containing protein [Chryseobacterium sp. SL1]MCY1663106.1 CHC2 zinc finger domain-containing protein [Chryseobacterium sp. SL1]MCY1663115.1 CHC2 zinc finger domain-containing protein [Chryseobacterium sp. SL1]